MGGPFAAWIPAENNTDFTLGATRQIVPVGGTDACGVGGVFRLQSGEALIQGAELLEPCSVQAAGSGVRVQFLVAFAEDERVPVGGDGVEAALEL